MKRWLRILLNLLLPPGIAGLLVMTFAMISSGHLDWRGLGVVELMAYLVALIPSALHAWVMEISYRRGFAPEGGRAIGISSASGCVAGVLIFAVFAVGTAGTDWDLLAILFYPVLGVLTGAVTGLIVGYIAWHLRGASKV